MNIMSDLKKLQKKCVCGKPYLEANCLDVSSLLSFLQVSKYLKAFHMPSFIKEEKVLCLYKEAWIYVERLMTPFL